MGLKSMLGGSKKEPSAKRAPARNESLREDPAADQKRVARQRLIGSVALLLAAIVILPLVLEDEPKPVSAEIALQIPSRDLAVRSQPDAEPPRDPVADKKSADAKTADGKVAEKAADTSPDKSSARAAGADKASDKAPDKAVEKAADIVPSDRSASGKSVVEKPVADKPAEQKIVRAEPKSDARTEQKPDPRIEPKSGPRPEPKTEPKAGKHLNVVQGDDPIAGFADRKPAGNSSATQSAQSAAASPTVSTPRSNHWVQIGAFGNESRAREMASQLRGKGYPAVTEVVRGGNGEMYRVRVGPLETRESANRARDNLAKAGFDGSVVQ